MPSEHEQLQAGASGSEHEQLTAGSFATNAQPGIPTNPISFATGLVGNAIKGLGRAATGIIDLIAAGVHDTIGVVQEFVPGEQTIEHEGYKFAQIARALPELRHDYARRYGGFSNIMRGLYEDPFSYISDAFIVAGGVGVAAKAGRVGGLMGKLPFTVMSDEAAARVLGVALKPGMKADDWLAKLEMASASTAPGVTHTIPYSPNPAVRLLQQRGAVALSSTPEKFEDFADLLARANDPWYTRTREAINYAAENGIRIWKPKVGEFLSTRATSWTLAKLKVVISQESAVQRAIFEDIMEGSDTPEAEAITQYGRGYAAVVTMQEQTHPLAQLLDPELVDAAENLHPRDFPKHLADEGFNVAETHRGDAFEMRRNAVIRDADKDVQDNMGIIAEMYPHAWDTTNPRVKIREPLGEGNYLGVDTGENGKALTWEDEAGNVQASIEFDPEHPEVNMLYAATNAPAEAVPELLDALAETDPERWAQIINNKQLAFTHKGALAFQRSIRRWNTPKPVMPRVDPITVATPAEWLGYVAPDGAPIMPATISGYASGGNNMMPEIKALENAFPNKGWDMNNINTPISGEFVVPKEDLGKTGFVNDVVVYVDKMSDAPVAGKKALDAMNLEFAGIVNSLNDEKILGDYFTLAGKKADGQVMHINVATKELYREQQMASHLIEYGHGLDEAAVALQGVLSNQATPRGQVDKVAVRQAMDAFDNLRRERQAWLALREDAFRGHRMAFWHENGSPADIVALKGEAIRAAMWPTVQRWVDMKLSDTPMWDFMTRAYGEQRLWRYHGMLSNMRTTALKALTEGIVDPTQTLARMLTDSGVPEDLVTSILGGHNFDIGTGYREMGLKDIAKGRDRELVAKQMLDDFKGEYGLMHQQTDAAGNAAREVVAAIKKYSEGDDSGLELFMAAMPDYSLSGQWEMVRPGNSIAKVMNNHPDLVHMPPVKEGFSRIYRGTNLLPGDDSAAWWTLSYDEALGYARNKEDFDWWNYSLDELKALNGEHPPKPSSRVWYRDVPTKMLEELRNRNPDAVESAADLTDAERLAYSNATAPKTHRSPNLKNDTRKLSIKEKLANPSKENRAIKKDLEETFKLSERQDGSPFGYHWSPKSKMGSIKREGIKPSIPADADIAGGYPSAVYQGFSGKDAYDKLPPNKAKDAVLYRIRRHGPEVIYDDKEFAVERLVPPEDIQYLGADKQWHDLTGDADEETLMDFAVNRRIAEGERTGIGSLTEEDIPIPAWHFYLRDKFLGKAVNPARLNRGNLIRAQKQVDKFIRRANGGLRDIMVKEGSVGAELSFPDYDWRVMRKERLLGDMPVPSYLPDIPKYTANGLGMVAETATGIPHKSTTFSRQWTGDLAESGNRLNDPVELMSRAAAIMIEHQETNDSWLRILRESARKATVNDIKIYRPGQYASEVMVSKDSVSTWLAQRADIMSETLEAVGDGEAATMTEAVNMAIEELQSKAFTEGVNNINTDDIYFLPRSVAQAFEKEMRYRFGHNVRVYWDGPMNLWKASVLSLSPRWLLNNLFGNQVFMALENPGAIRLSLEQMDKKTAHITDQILGAWSREASRGFFSENQRFRSVIPDDATGLLGEIKKAQNSAGAQQISKAGTWVRNKNNVIEQAARRGTLLNSLQRQTVDHWYQGFHSSYDILEESLRSGNITPGKMNTAMRSVDKTLGNYTQYSALEQGIIRRFLFPFWGFYRHAAKVMLRMPFEHPLKFKVLSTIEQIDRELEPDMPDWMRGRVTLGMLGTDNLMLNLQNMNPLSAFGEGVPLISTLNPVAKIAIERQLGVDTYTGEPFRGDENVIETWNGSYQMQFDGDGNFIGVERMTGKPLPSLLTHVAQQFPQLQFLPTFQRYPKSSWLQLASYLGIPLSQIDVEGMRAQRADADAAALTTAQNRLAGGTGGGSEHEQAAAGGS